MAEGKKVGFLSTSRDGVSGDPGFLCRPFARQGNWNALIAVAFVVFAALALGLYLKHKSP